MIGRIMAVSYTHLDVYKRQIHSSPRGSLAPGANRLSGRSISADKLPGFCLSPSGTGFDGHTHGQAVSYTHLDVYKRQTKS